MLTMHAVPAGHWNGATHMMRSLDTAKPFATLHGTQLMPSCEYVEPTHAAQPLRFVIGCLPGAHALQVVLLRSTTFGLTHSAHVPEME